MSLWNEIYFDSNINEIIPNQCDRCVFLYLISAVSLKPCSLQTYDGLISASSERPFSEPHLRMCSSRHSSYRHWLRDECVFTPERRLNDN